MSTDVKSLLEGVFLEYIVSGEPPKYADVIAFIRETDELVGQDRIQIHAYLRSRCLDTRIARAQLPLYTDQVYSAPQSPIPGAFGVESNDVSEDEVQLAPVRNEEGAIK